MHRLRMLRLLLLSLRNLLDGGGDVPPLICGCRLYLFLRRVFLCGFGRFVTHDPKIKVRGNWRQPGGGAFPIAPIPASKKLVNPMFCTVSWLTSDCMGSKLRSVVKRIVLAGCGSFDACGRSGTPSKQSRGSTELSD